MKFLTALLATLALSVTQPAYAQVYTQQEINYLEAMEQSSLVASDAVMQRTLTYAHYVCHLRKEGFSSNEVIDYSIRELYYSLESRGISEEQAYDLASIIGVSVYYAEKELCPDVR